MISPANVTKEFFLVLDPDPTVDDSSFQWIHYVDVRIKTELDGEDTVTILMSSAEIVIRGKSLRHLFKWVYAKELYEVRRDVPPYDDNEGASLVRNITVSRFRDE